MRTRSENEKKNKNVKKVLYISIDYLSMDTADMMAREPEENNMGLTVYNYEFGYILQMPKERIMRTANRSSFPKDLRACMTVAENRECDAVVFDEIADKDDEVDMLLNLQRA